MTLAQQLPVKPSASPDGTIPVTADVSCLQDLIVNVIFVGEPGGPWTLVDAGMPYTAGRIRQAAERRFGPRNRPQAIILTHGHFDHVGGLPTLADEWGVPIFAHPLEMPYLTGQSSYPPPDPTVGGGMMARLSPLYPRGPYDFGNRVHTLPMDGTVPGMPGWRWVHTPGHTAGHVSLFRDSDRTLIAGDAFVTTRQESALAAMTQYPRVSRPPAYYTADWAAARQSVELLLGLNPAAAVTGHGLPMRGGELRGGLGRLVRDFDAEMPSHGRYVGKPARADARGVVSVPPPVPDRFTQGVAAVAVMGGVAAIVAAVMRRRGD